jgi:hypothetical protein
VVYLHPFLTSAIYGSVVKSHVPPVSFRGKALQYPLKKILFGHERRSGGFGEEDRLLRCQVRTPYRATRGLFTIFTEIPRFPSVSVATNISVHVTLFIYTVIFN